MADPPTLIVGEEEFLAEQELTRRVGQVLDPDAQRAALDVLDGAAPASEILTRLDTMPFFGPQRVVVVRRLEAMREADQEALAQYLERGGSPTVGIFVARDLDRRRRLYQAFRRHGIIVEARPLPPREVPAWVAERFRAAGKQPAPGAAEALVALAGANLRDLDHEVAKVAAYVGDRPRVTSADVEAIATRMGEASIFALVDALGGRDAPRALVALHEILATHEPLQVLFMVARQYRLILKAHTLGPRAGAQLAERLGVHPYVARKIADQARGYRREQFPGIFAALEAADRAIKTGSPARLVLEMLFVRLCDPDRRRRTASVPSGGRA